MKERIIAEAISAMIDAENTCGTNEYPYHTGRIFALMTVYGDRIEFKKRVMSDPRAVETWKDHF